MAGGIRAGAALLCGLLSGAPGWAGEAAAQLEVGRTDASDPAAASDPEPGAARRWNGFFQVREQFPLTMGFLVIEPLSGFTLPAGRWELELTITESNTFTASQVIERQLEARQGRGPFDRGMFDELAATDPKDQSFYLDAQVGRFALRARRGLGAGFEVGLLVPVFRVDGGNTDRLVEAFHELTQLDQEGRDGVYRDRLALFVSGQGFDLDLEGSSGPELGDLVLSVKKRLAGDGTTRSLLIDVDLKLPTGDERDLIGSGAVDVGLSLAGSRCWRSRCAHAMAGVVRAGAAESLPIESQSLLSAALGFEQRWRKGWGLTVQFQYWQSYLGDLGFEHFSEDTIQGALTVSRGVGGGSELHLGLSENSFSFKNSSDVTYHLGWRTRIE